METKVGAEVAIDWVSITFPDGMLPGEVAAEFDQAWNPEPRGFGTRGYAESAVWGGITMSWGATAGVHVEVPGKACAELESSGHWCWQARFRKWGQLGARVTRLDVAFDDHEGYATLARVKAHLMAGAYTTRAQKGRIVAGFALGGDLAKEGETIYLGSPASDSMLRVYDKAAEQHVEGTWTRFEMQWRRDRADAVAMRFAMEGPSVFAGLLFGYVQFRAGSDHTRRKNDEVALWWAGFLQTCEGLRLRAREVSEDLAKVANWFVHAMAPTLALAAVAFRMDMQTLSAIIESGRDRWNGRQRELVRRWQVSQEKVATA